MDIPKQTARRHEHAKAADAAAAPKLAITTAMAAAREAANPEQVLVDRFRRLHGGARALLLDVARRLGEISPLAGTKEAELRYLGGLYLHAQMETGYDLDKIGYEAMVHRMPAEPDGSYRVRMLEVLRIRIQEVRP